MGAQEDAKLCTKDAKLCTNLLVLYLHALTVRGVRGVTEKPDGSVHVRVRHAGVDRSRTFSRSTPEKNLAAALTWRDEVLKQAATAQIEADQEAGVLPPGIYFREGRYYQAVVSAELDPKRPRRQFPTLEEAVEWLAQATETLTRIPDAPLPEPASKTGIGIAQEVPEAATLFGEAGLRWLDAYYSERRDAGRVQPQQEAATRRRFALHLMPTLGHFRLDEVDEKAHLVPLVKKWAEEGLAQDSTPSICLWMMRRIFRYAIDQGWCTRNPAAEIQPRPPKVKTRTKAGGRQTGQEPVRVPVKLMSQIAGDLRDHYDEEYALAALLYRYAGLRNGEAFGLALRDINLERHQIRVTKQRGQTWVVIDPETEEPVELTWVAYTKGKRNGDRLVPLLDVLEGPLRAHLARRIAGGAQPTDPLLVGPHSPAMLTSQVATVLREASEPRVRGQWKDGTQKYVRPHALRHQFSSDVQAARVEGWMRSKLLGHKAPHDRNSAAPTTQLVYSQTYIDFEAEEWSEELTEFDEQLEAVRLTLNDYYGKKLAEAGVPVIAEPAEDSQDSEWLTLDQAAERAGVTHDTLHHWTTIGALAATRRSLERRDRRRKFAATALMVRSDDLDALLEERASIVGTTEAARLLSALGLPMSQPALERLCDRLGITVHPATTPVQRLDNTWVYVTSSDFDRLADAVTARVAFEVEHVQRAEAAQVAGISVASVDRLEKLGLLHRVTPDLDPAIFERDSYVWYSRQELLAAAAHVQPRRRRKRAA